MGVYVKCVSSWVMDVSMEWEIGFDTKCLYKGWFESLHIIWDLCALALSFRLFLVSPIYWIWQMLQVYKYITFSESQLISEVIENVSFVAWLVKFWHSTMILHVLHWLFPHLKEPVRVTNNIKYVKGQGQGHRKHENHYLSHNFWTGSRRDFWLVSKCSLSKYLSEVSSPHDASRNVFASHDVR